MSAATHLHVSLALQAVSSVMALQALLALTGFLAASCAYAATPNRSTAAAADAPNNLPMAVMSFPRESRDVGTAIAAES